MLKSKGMAIRELFESEGSAKFCAKINELLEGDKPQLRPDDFSLRELHEAVDVSTFTTITGSLISKKVIAAYTEAAKVGDLLVSSFNSRSKVDIVPTVSTQGDLDDVKSGSNYPHSGDMKEAYVTITGNKRGVILDVDEDAITFDQTGLILRQAEQFGRKAANDREKRILYTMQDATVAGKNFYAWYPSGTRAALYTTGTTAPHTNANLITNILTDYTDLDAAKLALSKMVDDNTPSERVPVTAKILLVPSALDTTANRLINNTILPGAGNQENNPFSGWAKVISSVFLDAVSAVCWYVGDFQSQYAEKVVYPVQVLTRRMNDNNDDAWERDVVASYKVRHFTQVGAVDHRYVVKSSGTV